MKIQLTRMLVACVLLFLIVAGPSDCDNTSTTTPPVEITLLHTNDIHSHMRPEKIGERNPYGLGGLARMKTLIDRIRLKVPGSLLLDAGDWSEGNLRFNTEAGSNILRILSTMGFNAAVIGNHDFLNGPNELASTIERSGVSFPILAANKDLSNLSTAEQNRFNKIVKDYVVLNASNGVRLAVIGLLTEDFVYYEYFRPGAITSSADKASEIAKYIREKNLADVIVLLSHNSFTNNVNLARIVPWVNVVISGHSHVKTAEPTVVENAGQPVYVVEAKQWGQFLGEMTLLVDKGRKQVRLKKYTLHPVSSDLPENSDVAAMIDADEEALSSKYGRDILVEHGADCTDEMNLTEEKEGPLTNLLADTYRHVLGADIGLESGKLAGVGISPGPLSVFDVLNMNPHIYSPVAGLSFPQMGRIWKLYKLKIRGADLASLLNLVLLASTKIALPVGWIGISGARLTYSPTAEGANPLYLLEVWNSLTSRYEPVDRSRYYTLGIHDGLLLSVRLLIEKFHLVLDISRLEDSNIDVGQALLQFADFKKTFRASDFEARDRYQTVEPDVGFFEHNVRLRREGMLYFVDVDVRNYGLTELPDGYSIRALRGSPNDPVYDFTPGNEKFPISMDVGIGKLSPGAKTTISIPWVDLPALSPVGALYSLQLKVVGDPSFLPANKKDANATNNEVIVHFSVKL